MKYFLSFLFMSFLGLNLIMAQQVYISKINKDKVLVGPELVSPMNVAVATYHLDMSEKHIEALNDIQTRNLQRMDELDPTIPKKKLKKEKARIIRKNKLIQLELEVTQQISALWNDALEIEKKKQELYALSQRENASYDVITTDGTFDTNQYEFIIEKGAALTHFTTSIPVRYTPGKNGWVTKKSSSVTTSTCCSSSTDNSYLMSREDIAPKFYFKQMAGSPYNKEKCPLGFEFEPKQSNCIQSGTFQPNNATDNQNIILVDSNSKETIKMTDFQVADTAQMVKSSGK